MYEIKVIDIHFCNNNYTKTTRTFNVQPVVIELLQRSRHKNLLMALKTLDKVKNLEQPRAIFVRLVK